MNIQALFDRDVVGIFFIFFCFRFFATGSCSNFAHHWLGGVSVSLEMLDFIVKLKRAHTTRLCVLKNFLHFVSSLTDISCVIP